MRKLVIASVCFLPLAFVFVLMWKNINVKTVKQVRIRERLFDDPILFSIGVLILHRIQRRYLLKYIHGWDKKFTDLGCIIHLVVFQGGGGFEVIVIKQLPSN